MNEIRKRLRAALGLGPLWAAAGAIVGALIDRPSPENRVLVAEDGERRPLGFVHVHAAVDFFTAEQHGHISDLVVAEEGERRGVGWALLTAAENWARKRGYRLLTLNVFTGNERARMLYERAGFPPATIKLVEQVDPVR